MKTAVYVLDSRCKIKMGSVELRDAFRIYMREVPNLTPLQLSILLFILDRTLGWNKMWEKINARHISEGIRNVSVGFNVSTRTVYRAFKELFGRGLIIIVPVANNYRLISLARYLGFMTYADHSLFEKNDLDIDFLSYLCQNLPEIPFRYPTDRISGESGQNDQTYKEEIE